MGEMDREADLLSFIAEVAKAAGTFAALWQVTRVHKKVKSNVETLHSVDANVNGKMRHLMDRNQQLRNILADNAIDVPDLPIERNNP